MGKLATNHPFKGIDDSRALHKKAAYDKAVRILQLASGIQRRKSRSILHRLKTWKWNLLQKLSARNTWLLRSKLSLRKGPDFAYVVRVRHDFKPKCPMMSWVLATKLHLLLSAETPIISLFCGTAGTRWLSGLEIPPQTFLVEDQFKVLHGLHWRVTDEATSNQGPRGLNSRAQATWTSLLNRMSTSFAGRCQAAVVEVQDSGWKTPASHQRCLMNSWGTLLHDFLPQVKERWRIMIEPKKSSRKCWGLVWILENVFMHVGGAGESPYWPGSDPNCPGSDPNCGCPA